VIAFAPGEKMAVQLYSSKYGRLNSIEQSTKFLSQVGSCCLALVAVVCQVGSWSDEPRFSLAGK
jgi:hypothetical protein